MASTPVLRRALLYVPTSSPRMLAKSRALAVDTVAYDLEDSVSPSQKSEARDGLLQFLRQAERPAGPSEIAVRINAPSTGLALDDLTAVSQLKFVDTVVIPKVSGPADIKFVTDALRHNGGNKDTRQVRLIASIESARAIQSLESICKASPLLSGLLFAAEDFALDLSLTRTPGLTEFLYARSAIVTAATAARLSSIIDLVHTSYTTPDALQTLHEESHGGKRLGFNGKQVIHPSQVDIVQKVFTPSEDEVRWAARITAADEKAEKMGKGAWGLDGKMIDAPVIGKARAVLLRATQCQVDVEAIVQDCIDVEPE